jgi:DNA-binding transcriptional MerR regulator
MMFRIGAFSRLSQVSVKTLRFYDEVGLLKPTFVDAATGYRYYSANLLPRLNRILVLKDLGFSLDEIAPLLAGEIPVSEVQELLLLKRAELKNDIGREQARLAQVEMWLGKMQQEGRVPDYEIVLRRIAPQLVASVRESLGSYDEAAELFTELNHHLKNYNAYGQHAAVWYACAGQAERIDCEAVVFLNRPVPAGKRITVYQFPPSVNACMIHQGSDETITQAYHAAHSWIKTQGYAIAGPLCELYWQGSVDSGNDGFSVTEIRYPVLKLQTPASVGN